MTLIASSPTSPFFIFRYEQFSPTRCLLTTKTTKANNDELIFHNLIERNQIIDSTNATHLYTRLISIMAPRAESASGGALRRVDSDLSIQSEGEQARSYKDYRYRRSHLIG